MRDVVRSSAKRKRAASKPCKLEEEIESKKEESMGPAVVRKTRKVSHAAKKSSKLRKKMSAKRQRGVVKYH
ncbi:hypothetical protein ONS96_005656 [Cadophora gregata f. sp. sojae]|nr:hypothetical protein ONS96_005656 [Cadophora gregata f. sp. sojae]